MRELDYGAIGIKIRQARKAKGWSQEGLAKRCGISMSFLGHIERGTRIMSLGTFANICIALDIDADSLLWNNARPSETMLEVWKLSGQKTAASADSYARYVRIMESVAEIMNEA